MIDLELEKVVSGPSLAKGGSKEKKEDDPNDKEFGAGYTEKDGPYITCLCRT